MTPGVHARAGLWPKPRHSLPEAFHRRSEEDNVMGMGTRRTAVWALAWCLAAVISISCSKKERQAPRYSFPVEVNSVLSDGIGVADAIVYLNGEEVGQTDYQGQISATIEGSPGQTVTLTIDPPQNFVIHPDEGAEEWIGTLKAEEKGNEILLEPLTFTVKMKPTVLDYALLIAVQGGTRQLVVNGQPSGTTNSKGVATLLLTEKPGRGVEVLLAKPEGRAGRKHKALGATYTLGESERILHFFEGEAPVGETDKDVGAAVPEPTPEELAAKMAAEAELQRLAAEEAEQKVTEEAKKAEEEARLAALEARKAEEEAKRQTREEEKLRKKEERRLAKEARAEEKQRKAEERKLAAAARAEEKRLASEARAEQKQRKAEERAAAAAEKKRQREEERRHAAALKTAKSEERAALMAERKAKKEEARRRKAEQKAARKDADRQKAEERAAAASERKQQRAEEKALRADEARQKREEKKMLAEKKRAEREAKRQAALEGKRQKAEERKRLAEQKKAERDAKRQAALDAKRKEKEAREEAKRKAEEAKTTAEADAKRLAALSVTERERAEAKKIADTMKAPAAGCPLGDLKKGNISDGVLTSCSKLPKSNANYSEAHRLLSKYWMGKKNLKKAYDELKLATTAGRNKYDPSVLHAQVKLAIKLGKLSEALRIKDRYLHVESRLPSSVRAKKTAELYHLFAKSYEHLFYRKHNNDPEGDYTHLLDKSIDMWERYSSYLGGGDSLAKKEIANLKKMKSELIE